MAALPLSQPILASDLTSDRFHAHLASLVEAVEQTLQEVIPSQTRLHHAMAHSVLGGGKRLRAFLVWESARLFDVSPPLALQTAAAIECVHAYSLAHDDLPCMDNANTRRGKPSCHIAFGESTAVLTGDALGPLAFEILADLETSADNRLALVKTLAQAIGPEGLVAGQMIDLGNETLPQTYEDLCTLQRLKTGVLFSFAAEAGAILGNRSPAERETLRAYGLALGQVFQMIDDLLDGSDNPEELGKPCGQDASKLTFLSLLGPDKLYEKATFIGEDACVMLNTLQGDTTLLKEAVRYALERAK